MIFIKKIKDLFTTSKDNIRIDKSEFLEVGFRTKNGDIKIVALPKSSYDYTIEIGIQETNIVLRTDIYLSEILTISDKMVYARNLSPVSEVIGSDDCSFVYCFTCKDIDVDEKVSLDFISKEYEIEDIDVGNGEGE